MSVHGEVGRRGAWWLPGVAVVIAVILFPGARCWGSPDAGRHVRVMLLGYDAESYYALETTIDNPGSYYTRRETLSWVQWSFDGRKLASRIISDVEHVDTTTNGGWRRRVIAADSLVSVGQLCPSTMRLAGLMQPNPARQETLSVVPEGLILRREGGRILLAGRTEVQQFVPLRFGRVCNGITEASEITIAGTVRGEGAILLIAHAGELCCSDADAVEFLIPISAAKMSAAREIIDTNRREGLPFVIPRSWLKTP